MSVQSLINRIKQNVSNSLNALKSYGVTVPSTSTSDNLTNLINSIQVLKYYTGATTPSSSLGNNGDIYLQL